MNSVWDGCVTPMSMSEGKLPIRHRLADAAKRCDWRRVSTILENRRDLVNATRPGGSSLCAPLHPAAHGGAPPEVVGELVRHCGCRYWSPYGGFSYFFRRDGVAALLVSESWCRVVMGSGERHEITSEGSRLVSKGFA